ncbi:helix-turn-helix domain-containing protein [Candidatus Calescamantes bacterium]|nr:helix-turn-helix domain-containing protein [Candidatus Calescamantes bacterium]
MMEKFGEIMTLDKTAKYLKTGESTLYKMAREDKIPAVKLEPGRNMTASRGMHIRSSADISQNCKNIRNAEMNKLCDMPKGGVENE